MKKYKKPILGKFKKVINMTSSNGNYIPNQFKIEFEKGVVFQSYNSIIAIIKNDGQVYIGQNYDYSKTTGKYRNDFLYEDKKETDRQLKNGEYKMLNI